MVKKILFAVKAKFFSSLSYNLITGSTANSRLPIVIIHGLFGSKNNWRSLAKEISKNCECQVYTLDLPNHGKSLHSKDLNSVSQIATFVSDFIQTDLKLPSYTLIGHSLGGKICMQMALMQTANDLNKLVVVDMPPHSKIHGSSETRYILNILEELSLSKMGSKNLADTRRSIDQILKFKIPDLNIRQFLLSNLYLDQHDSRYKWKFNVSNLKELLDHFDLIYKPNSQFLGKTLFLCGSLSKFVTIDDHMSIKALFPNSTVEYVPDSGHWVHFDKPYVFLDKIKVFCMS